jgi:hypothetical protein
MLKFRFYDIDWDTDGEEVDLPKSVVLDVEPEVAGQGVAIVGADVLSDKFGWCVNSFQWSDWVDPGTRVKASMDLHIGHEGTIPKGATGTFRGVSEDAEGHYLFEMDEDHGFLQEAYSHPNVYLGDCMSLDCDNGEMQPEDKCEVCEHTESEVGPLSQGHGHDSICDDCCEDRRGDRLNK